MRSIFGFLMIAAVLAGCAPTIGNLTGKIANPDPLAPDYNTVPLGADPLAADAAATDDAAAIAAEALAALEDGADAGADANRPLMSDENNFDAVASRETIQSDAARIERNAQNYQVIEATPLPKPAGDTGPNIVAYALETSHPVGQAMYPRVKLASEFRYKRACSQLGSPDQAQRSFLTRGGPKVDWYGVDPDGDGYACDWDPTPFRKAAGQ